MPETSTDAQTTNAPPETEADWMAFLAGLCQPHGEEHDALTCLRLLAEASLEGGRWSPTIDSCDCGDGYGCPHGSWVASIHFEKTHGSNDRPCNPDDTLDSYRHERSDISEFTWDEAHFIVAAQPSVVLGLIKRLQAAEALPAKWEKDYAERSESGWPEQCASDLRAVLAIETSTDPSSEDSTDA